MGITKIRIVKTSSVFQSLTGNELDDKSIGYERFYITPYTVPDAAKGELIASESLQDAYPSSIGLMTKPMRDWVKDVKMFKVHHVEHRYGFPVEGERKQWYKIITLIKHS